MSLNAFRSHMEVSPTEGGMLQIIEKSMDDLQAPCQGLSDAGSLQRAAENAGTPVGCAMVFAAARRFARSNRGEGQMQARGRTCRVYTNRSLNSGSSG